MGRLRAFDRTNGFSDRIVQYTDRYDDLFARRVMLMVRKLSKTNNGRVHELDQPITWDEVYAALSRLPNNKCPGADGIVGELLRNAGLGFATAITAIFNHIWTFHVWPDDWQKAFLIPLYKGKGMRNDPSNQRLLALTSVFSKLFEKVLDTRIRTWSERIGALSDLQGGFRTDRGCPDQIFALHEIVMMRKECGQQTVLAFIDVAKAYDRVWRPGLWKKN